MLSKLEKKQKLPVCYFPSKGPASVHPSASEVQSQGAGGRGVCAQVRGYAHAYAQMCVIPAKSKALANGDPRQGSPLRLSSHITDGEISQQQPHSLRPLLVPFSHSAIYYCPTRWIVQSQGRYPTEISSESPSPSPAWRGRGFSLSREPAEQPKQHILLPSQHSHTIPSGQW